MPIGEQPVRRSRWEAPAPGRGRGGPAGTQGVRRLLGEATGQGEAEITLPQPCRARGQFGFFREDQEASEYEAVVTCPDLWVLLGPSGYSMELKGAREEVGRQAGGSHRSLGGRWGAQTVESTSP